MKILGMGFRALLCRIRFVAERFYLPQDHEQYFKSVHFPYREPYIRPLFFSPDRAWLESILPVIKDFLWNNLHLKLHPDKVSITTIASGVDFLGWVHFLDHRVLRTTTKRRMFRGVQIRKGKQEAVQSYLGLLRHGNTEKLQRRAEDYSIGA